MQSSLHVFLSFKTEEREIAIRLKTALNDAGFIVWWQEEIQCGHEWHGVIDKAVEEAGAIVVLWSKKSMQSPWVKHEASQAVAKNIYTPVRIELLEIESPYNRTQATDLVNWSGDSSHPGFENLLLRLKELMPPPIPPLKRVSNFAWKHRATLVLSIIAGFALFLLFRQSAILDSQLEKQDQLIASVQRTVEPISDLQISAVVTISPSVPGVQEFLAYLDRRVSESSDTSLTEYIPELKEHGKEIRFNSFEDTIMSHSFFALLITHIRLSLEFRDPAYVKKKYDKKDSVNLMFCIGPDDPDRAGREKDPTLHNRPDNYFTLIWNTESNELCIEFQDKSPIQDWVTNGKIISIPDIEKSAISIRFDEYPAFTTAHSFSKVVGRKERLECLAGFKLKELSIYSNLGKRLQLIGYKMREEKEKQHGLRVYTSIVKDASQ